MVLKLPRELLDYIMSQTNGRAMQTVIIEILRQHKQTNTYTENRGKDDGYTEKSITKER